ncbi:hypothetical protein JCM9492_08610 [Aquifex pyrophilus]
MVLPLRALILILVALTFVGTKLSGLYVLCVHENENSVHYELLHFSGQEGTNLTESEVHIDIDDLISKKNITLNLSVPLILLGFSIKKKNFKREPSIEIIAFRENPNKTVRLLI